MKCLKCSEWVLTVSMGHVTVRIHGKARNFLYCRPAVWNTQIQFLFHNIQNMLHIITRKSAELKSSYLIQLLDHLAHDFAVLFALTHLCCDDTLKKKTESTLKTKPFVGMLHVCARWQVCLPLHPEHWMKKLMRSRREESLSDPYASIQSSITACSGIKEDPVNHNIIVHN